MQDSGKRVLLQYRAGTSWIAASWVMSSFVIWFLYLILKKKLPLLMNYI